MDFIFYKLKGVNINNDINYVGNSVDISRCKVDIFVDKIGADDCAQYSLFSISAGRR